MNSSLVASERLRQAFASKAFIPFITCGDPDLSTTEKLVYALDKAGASLIELGIPFSDPVAEGPVIQAADARALDGGTTTDKVFALVRRLRRHTQIPLAFMTYANVVFSYGIDTFAYQMAQVGVDALILPDVPFEERSEFACPCEKEGVALISLVAPTSHRRIDQIARSARGFVYVVSSLGVSGERKKIESDVGAVVAKVHAVNPSIPCAVGFGITTPDQASAMAKVADGIIVGSSIVKLVGRYKTKSIDPVRDYVASMVHAIKNE